MNDNDIFSTITKVCTIDDLVEEIGEDIYNPWIEDIYYYLYNQGQWGMASVLAAYYNRNKNRDTKNTKE